MITHVQNGRGEWVPDIPLPFYRWWRFECTSEQCHQRFWTERAYRGHYALQHILAMS